MSTMTDVSLEKAPDVTFITCHICFEWYLLKNAMKKCGIVKIINQYQIYKFKHHVDSSKLHEKILEGKQSHKDEETKSKDNLGII